ncbi:hypothetical protein [Bacillus phage KonjoTrouble]|uniref:Uncharacterized protein n=5 Tax=Claudivirus TaxID=2842609 RepID=A0A514AAI8_9CAUD|nr:DNA binding protein [Bacillus phage Claudi]YP_009910220.1 DNA binding protein [Bacillus phage SerPounce]YP_009910298.1 DNA binding protein [Bacillus phage KonjoTrouble]YP_010114381.1 DNA binding protein [Bacillus phage Thornton]QDH50293.1 hypothetical protein VIOLETTEMAD_12 [Bacillus phage VioletteMad]ANT41165.1 hypothetical protein CLAUDI_11 [Bacillus phage Claudi]ARQ95546.1 DNA binding protein [Bacillus phage SerPounce]ASU04134.1 hypothetical protein [Bacillus phage KonjoTrouble]QQM150
MIEKEIKEFMEFLSKKYKLSINEIREKMIKQCLNRRDRLK